MSCPQDKLGSEIYTLWQNSNLNNHPRDFLQKVAEDIGLGRFSLETLWGKIEDLRRDLNQTEQHLSRANKTIASREEAIEGFKEEIRDRTNRMMKAQQLMGCSGCGGLHCPGGPSCDGQGEYQR